MRKTAQKKAMMKENWKSKPHRKVKEMENLSIKSD